MSRATGLLLIIVGVWLVIAALAGRLPERILALVLPGSGSAGAGGGFTGSAGGAGRPGAGGGAW